MKKKKSKVRKEGEKRTKRKISSNVIKKGWYIITRPKQSLSTKMEAR